MVRFTIRDMEKTVSFGEDAGLAQALVAACASEPELLEDLLPAVEPYAPGTAGRVITGLLAFDQIAEDGLPAPTGQPVADEAGTWGAPPAFEVFDPRSERLARTPDDEGLVCIDLKGRSISGQMAAPRPIAARGTLEHRAPGGALRRMAFVLSDRWAIDVETDQRAAPAVAEETHA
jgi:hypothetical protein